MSNPCMSCSIDMDCCKKFNGVLMSQEEFDRLYAKFEGRFQVEQRNRFVMVTDISGEGCPYFKQGTGCTVYEERPLDCRLFPFSLDHVRGGEGDTMRASAHRRVGCPHSEEFPIDREQVGCLTDGMARSVGHSGAEVELEYGLTWWKYAARRAVRRLKALTGA